MTPKTRWKVAADALVLTPVHHLEPAASGEPGEWLATGDDPQFLVKGDFPAGWTELRFRANTEQNGGRMMLYHAVDQAFVEARCEELGSMSRTRSWYTRYVYLPERCNTLRFDPLDCSGQFRISDVTFRPISHPLAGARLGGNVLWHVASTHRSKELFHYAKRLVAVGLKPSLKEVVKGYFAASTPHVVLPEVQAYAEYLRRTATSPEQLHSMRTRSARLAHKPVFSIVVPTYNVEERWLRAMIDSVQRQAYPNWELCIADDASTQPHVRNVLEEYRRRDARIKVV